MSAVVTQAPAAPAVPAKPVRRPDVRWDGGGRAPRVADIINISSSANTLLRDRVLAMRDRGIDNRIVCIDGPYVPRLRALGIPVYTTSLTRGYSAAKLVRAVLDIAGYLRRERIDLVHTHSSIPGVIGRVAARLARVPLVVHTVHGFHFHDRSSRLQRLFYVSIERCAGMLTDHLFSQNFAGIEQALTHGIVPASRLSYIGNGIDLRRFSPRSCPRCAGSPPTITCVARLEPVKNHELLFDAVRLLHERGVCFRLQLIGEGELRSDYEARLARAGISHLVRFLGYREDMPELLASTDVAVLTSIKEGIPRALLEAMAMGVPVVATRVSGTREVVLDGETGFVVELGDAVGLARAIERLLGDPGLCARFGARARLVAVARFDEDDVVDALFDQYQALFARRGSLRPAGIASVASS